MSAVRVEPRAERPGALDRGARARARARPARVGRHDGQRRRVVVGASTRRAISSSAASRPPGAKPTSTRAGGVAERPRPAVEDHRDRVDRAARTPDASRSAVSRAIAPARSRHQPSGRVPITFIPSTSQRTSGMFPLRRPLWSLPHARPRGSPARPHRGRRAWPAAAAATADATTTSQALNTGPERARRSASRSCSTRITRDEHAPRRTATTLQAYEAAVGTTVRDLRAIDPPDGFDDAAPAVRRRGRRLRHRAAHARAASSTATTRSAILAAQGRLRTAVAQTGRASSTPPSRRSTHKLQGVAAPCCAQAARGAGHGADPPGRGRLPGLDAARRRPGRHALGAGRRSC